MTPPTTPLQERAPWALVIGGEPFVVGLDESHRTHRGQPTKQIWVGTSPVSTPKDALMSSNFGNAYETAVGLFWLILAYSGLFWLILAYSTAH